MIRRQDWALIGLTQPVAGVQTRMGENIAKSSGDLTAILHGTGGRSRDVLTLGVTCALSGDAGRRLLSAFLARNPVVDLVVKDVDEVSLEAGLSDGDIDLVIAPVGAARGRWQVTPLWRERLVAVLPLNHPLAAGDIVNPEMLRQEVVLLAGHKAGDRALQKAISHALGGPPNGLLHFPVQRDTLFDLVALGFGVTISSPAALGASYPGVCLRPIGGDTAQIGYDLYSDPETESHSVQRFLSVVEHLANGVGLGHPAQL